MAPTITYVAGWLFNGYSLMQPRVNTSNTMPAPVTQCYQHQPADKTAAGEGNQGEEGTESPAPSSVTREHKTH